MLQIILISSSPSEKKIVIKDILCVIISREKIMIKINARCEILSFLHI